MELFWYCDFEDYQCYFLQCDIDDFVYCYVDQVLGQLIGVGVDGGDGDDGQCYIYCGGQNYGVGVVVDEYQVMQIVWG